MSGPISVPAAIAAAYVENPTARILLALTAVVSFIFSSFWVWKIEREKRLAIEASLALATKPFPNWPIHEVFSYIQPDVLERPREGTKDRWDEVGDDIRDQASLGRLKIWGRVAHVGADKNTRSTYRSTTDRAELLDYRFFHVQFF